LFPRLALGLSGFETGVSVMPLIKCEGLDPAFATLVIFWRLRRDHERFLMATAYITTLLISGGSF